MTKQQILEKYSIPLPDGEILELQYNMGRQDWYARTDKGWNWYDPERRFGSTFHMDQCYEPA